MEDKKCRSSAVILAAGAGKRMHIDVKKQFMLLGDKPLIYHSLKVFQESFVEEIVLVVSEEDREYCKEEIVDKYHFTKVKYLAVGGKERYHSVAAGLQCLSECDYVFIHDGARPMVTIEILNRAYECVKVCDACVVGMPVKDTIKIADKEGYITQTPDRNMVWLIQTPQVFSYKLIKEAYETLIRKEDILISQEVNITDDAMVVETLMNHPVKLVEGSYRNIKITTSEDLLIAESFVNVKY